jgi:hypothetical chaperone protein
VDLHRIAPDTQLLITRDDFDGAIAKLVTKTESTVRHMLDTAGVTADQVDTILFTGGSSSVPLLRQRLAELLPGAKRVEGDLFGGIGSGLARDAARKFG